jgi:hypothetical protein
MRVSRSSIAWLLGAALIAVAPVAAVADGGDPAVEDVLQILKERGLVDEGQYTELVAKHESWEAKNTTLLGRIAFSGDLRLRYENFWYDENDFGEPSNRNRLRYRLRLLGTISINEYVDAAFRLASGENDPRSNNRTLGFDNDFGPDAIFIDQAYIVLKAPKDWLPHTTLTATGGKTPNPYLVNWKSGKYDLLWDPDINPEGVSTYFGYKPNEDLSLYATAGYFIDKENGSSTDPHVLGIQGGMVWGAGTEVELGARLAWYSWRSLDRPFFERAASFGAILDGLTEGAPTKAADDYNTGDFAAYLRLGAIEGWPILIYGQVAKNFEAQRSKIFGSAGKEDLGWGLGVEVGDKKKLVMLGVGYFHLEANFWPAQFTESDLLDGFTNRKGWAFYGVREVLPNTELSVQLFVSDPIDQAPAFATSASGADRVRLQTDLMVKF